MKRLLATLLILRYKDLSISHLNSSTWQVREPTLDTFFPYMIWKAHFIQGVFADKIRTLRLNDLHRSETDPRRSYNCSNNQLAIYNAHQSLTLTKNVTKRFWDGTKFQKTHHSAHYETADRQSTLLSTKHVKRLLGVYKKSLENLQTVITHCSEVGLTEPELQATAHGHITMAIIQSILYSSIYVRFG